MIVSTFYKKITKSMFVVGVFVGLLSVTTLVAPAASATTPSLYNNGGSIPVYFAPNEHYSNVKVWSPSGTKFQMSCWLDNAGHRWFFGQEYSRGSWGYVISTMVRNQTVVGHC